MIDQCISRSIIFEGQLEERQFTMSGQLPTISVIKYEDSSAQSAPIQKDQIIAYEFQFYQGNQLRLQWFEDFSSKMSIAKISEILEKKFQEEIGSKTETFLVTSICGSWQGVKKKTHLVESLRKEEMEGSISNLIDGKQVRMIISYIISNQKYQPQSQCLNGQDFSQNSDIIISKIINQGD